MKYMLHNLVYDETAESQPDLDRCFRKCRVFHWIEALTVSQTRCPCSCLQDGLSKLCCRLPKSSASALERLNVCEDELVRSLLAQQQGNWDTVSHLPTSNKLCMSISASLPLTLMSTMTIMCSLCFLPGMLLLFQVSSQTLHKRLMLLIPLHAFQCACLELLLDLVQLVASVRELLRV